MPWPIGTLPIVDPDHFSDGSTIPGLSPGKSIPVAWPNPKRLTQRWIPSRPSSCASVTVPTFDECERICATDMRSVARGCESWMTRSATWSSYGSVNAVDGVTRRSESAPRPSRA